MSETSPVEGVARLDDLGVIRARGADAAPFLQGQLTQDVESMATLEWRLAGYCSAKGRLLASFVVCRLAEDEFWLVCSADLLAPTLKRLSMFVLRAKCKLDDASPELRALGIAGAGALAALGADAGLAVGRAALHAGGPLMRLPDAEGSLRHLWLAPLEAELPAVAPLSADGWRWLEVRSAVPRIVAATVEQFVPQMVNFELVGGVNFRKGCYPGQEIVARSQYRGTVKRRMMVFEVEGIAQAGQEVFHASDPEQPAGMVVNAAPAPSGGGRHALLAEIKLAALDGAAVRLGAAAGPMLSALPLPYEIPPAS